MNDSNYLLIDSKIVPEVFTKVIEVKKLLAKDSSISIHDAVKVVGISRSAFYKYKDKVYPFYEMASGRIMTILITAEDIPGILAEIISGISLSKSNIMTIHQNLPINGLADITITIETKDSIMDLHEMLDKIRKIKGVQRLDMLARE